MHDFGSVSGGAFWVKLSTFGNVFLSIDLYTSVKCLRFWILHAKGSIGLQNKSWFKARIYRQFLVLLNNLLSSSLYPMSGWSEQGKVVSNESSLADYGKRYEKFNNSNSNMDFNFDFTTLRLMVTVCYKSWLGCFWNLSHIF